MKKTLHYSIKILSVLTFCFFTYVYSAPVLYAQNTQADYTVLAPLPGTTNNCTGAECTTNFKTYFEGMFTFAIGVSAVLAFIMLSFAGFQYVTTDGIGGKSNAKERIENAVYGLLLVIGAYAILYTINPDILNFNLNIIRPNISSTDTGTSGGGNTSAGVNWTGVLPSTKNALADLQTQCGNCNVNVTSANDGTHDTTSTHYNGTGVDLSSNAKLDAYIKDGISGIKACDKFTKTLGGKSTRFLWEPKGSSCGGEVTSSGDHWHVTVTP